MQVAVSFSDISKSRADVHVLYVEVRPEPAGVVGIDFVIVAFVVPSTGG